MHGYQVTLYTVENRRHHGKQLSHWLLEVMREMNFRGVTHVVAAEGIGHHHRLHSWHFVELADRPEEITMIGTESEMQALFDRLAAEDLHVFYAKYPVEFGFLGKAAPGSGEPARSQS